jgi:RsiW-degrading membrane proteinase PrsW (M82 family)
MQFKPLELKQEDSWLKRQLQTPHTRRSLTAIGIGAIIGFLLFYFTEGRMMESMAGWDVAKSFLIGGFFGFFITNSPCARGRC